MRRVRFGKRLACPVHGARGDAIHLGHRGDLGSPFGTFGRQMLQPLPQLQEGVNRNQRVLTSLVMRRKGGLGRSLGMRCLDLFPSTWVAKAPLEFAQDFTRMDGVMA